MKKNLLLLIFISSVCLGVEIGGNVGSSTPDLSVYDRQFDAIGKKRVGLNDNDILSLKNPFISDDSMDKTKSVETDDPGLIGKSLNAIIANKVKINDGWYHLGDYVGSYKIVEIKEKSVIIENKTQNLELKLNQGSKNVIITVN